MSVGNDTLQARAREALYRHLREASEESLHEAYAFGRAALDAGLGVLDLAVILSRAARPPAGADPVRWAETGARTESFLLECLAPFEMAHRGVREANEALRRLDECRERDARRLAHQLHDQAGHVLPALGYLIDGLRPQVPEEAAESLDQARAMIEELAERLRRLSHELRPVMLDDLGLEPVLRFMAEGISERSGLEVWVEGTVGGRLPPEVEIVVYRAIQEALHNVVRHAAASHAVVELRRDERELVCRVVDDGRGFERNGACDGAGMRGSGLDAMRERLAAVNGNLAVGRAPTGGGLVTIWIPLEVRHADAPVDRR